LRAPFEAPGTTARTAAARAAGDRGSHSLSALRPLPTRAAQQVAAAPEHLSSCSRSSGTDETPNDTCRCKASEGRRRIPFDDGHIQASPARIERAANRRAATHRLAARGGPRVSRVTIAVSRCAPRSRRSPDSRAHRVHVLRRVAVGGESPCAGPQSDRSSRLRCWSRTARSGRSGPADDSLYGIAEDLRMTEAMSLNADLAKGSQ